MSETIVFREQVEPLQNGQIAAGAGIETSKLAQGAEFIQRDGSVAFTGDQSMNGNQLKDLAAPVDPNDAVRLIDLQNSAAGLSPLAPVRVATTANITLSGTQTIDGVVLVAGDRVLVKNQTSGAQNGIYNVAVGSWSRSTDADNSGEITNGSYVLVNEGATLVNTGWIQTAANPISIGTDDQVWTQFSAAQNLTAGDGMVKVGNAFNVQTANSARIVVNADNIDLATTGVAAGTYDKVTVDAYGRVTAASVDNGAGNWEFLVTPTGTVDGTNSAFTFPHNIVAGKLMLFRNGLLQDPGASEDYQVGGAGNNIVQFNTAPRAGSKIRGTYIKA